MPARAIRYEIQRQAVCRQIGTDLDGRRVYRLAEIADRAERELGLRQGSTERGKQKNTERPERFHMYA